MPHAQPSFRLRFDWGAAGAAAVVPGADLVVVVDVLSFTTTVTVALDLGGTVLPYPWAREDAREDAQEYAEQQGAVLAVGRRQQAPGRISLSPASLRRVGAPAALVLPSPNGSALAFDLAAQGRTCLAGCLRNASAVADWVDRQGGGAAGTVAVVAAGERWPDGSLRPAVEDLWGAGAVLAALAARARPASPEVEAAVAAWAAVRGRAGAALLACQSGQELAAGGFAEDVAVAAEVDGSTSVPLLRAGRFGPAP